MHVLITGASKGIGLATAKAIANSGEHHLYLVSRNRELLEAAASEINNNTASKAYSMPVDLQKTDELKKWINDILAMHTEVIDVLINNAGYLVNKRMEDITGEDLDRSVDINFKAPFFLVQQLLPLMAGSNVRHIVNISSMGGFQGSSKFPGLSVYSATKGALSTLTECLYAELADREYRVNCLALGAVNTEMLQAAFPGLEAPTEPDEMGDYIADFALHQWHFFNGKILPVTISNP